MLHTISLLVVPRSKPTCTYLAVALHTLQPAQAASQTCRPYVEDAMDVAEGTLAYSVVNGG
jgi:hypothetical protein